MPSNPYIGLRVRLREDVERYPHFTAPKGAEGVVTHAESNGGSVLIAVTLDEPLPGAEEWDNEVHWYGMELERQPDGPGETWAFAVRAFWQDCEEA